MKITVAKRHVGSLVGFFAMLSIGCEGIPEQPASISASSAAVHCPVRLYHGSTEELFAASTAELAKVAQSKGLDVRAIPVAGDHMSHVAEAMRQSIDFFREKASPAVRGR